MLIAMMMAAHAGAALPASTRPTIMASMTVSRPSTPPAPSPVGNEDTMLIVDGVRIDASAAALAACLARSCPPDEDMEAATVHAENQLLAGPGSRRGTGRRRTIADDLPRSLVTRTGQDRGLDNGALLVRELGRL